MVGLSPLSSNNLLPSNKLSYRLTTVLVIILLCFHHYRPSCDQQQQQQQSYHHKHLISFAQADHRFIDSSTLKPSLVLILPQSFKVPTNPFLGNVTYSDLPKLQQYVAIINNAQDDLEDEKIRRQYKRLSLQVRDARTPLTGQLFFEHQFEYFPPGSPKYQLIPINLEHVSVPYSTPLSARPSKIVKQQNSQQATYSKLDNNNNNNNGHGAADSSSSSSQAPQLIVSIRPVQMGSGDSVELVSSSPVLVEAVPSSDGRRSFSIVQTDKPIYKPNEKVRIRVMVVNENLRPIIGDELKLQIKNPHKIIVESVMFPVSQALTNQTAPSSVPKNFEPMFIDHTFEFPPEPMLGKWSVHLLHSDAVANDTTSFEVKEYVVPPFGLTIESPKYILPNTLQISGAAIAKYHFGKPVQGKLQFKFGYMSGPHRTKFVARSHIKNIDPLNGRVEYNISLEKFVQNEWFPQIAESRLVIEATATDMTTGHRETATDSSCVFMNMPYVIMFDDTIDDFKPGLTQNLVVKLHERIISSQPGPAGLRIFAEYRDQNNTLLAPRGNGNRGKFDTEARTDSAGRAVFRVGPVNEDVSLIKITMKLVDLERISAENQAEMFRSRGFTGVELAIGNHTLVRHESQNGWIALMNKSVTHVNVGDLFVSDLLIQDATMVLPQKIYYLIVARGQIITMDTINKEGLVSFRVTEAMMPSIRLVLFALTQDSVGLLSDSMRIEVNQNMDCGLRLEYRSAQGGERHERQESNSVRPNAKGRLEVSARQGDLVSIIGVDNAVYSLNNRTRPEASRIVDRIRLLDTGCGFGGGTNNLDVFHNAGLMLHKDAAGGETLGQIGSSCLANPMKYVEEAAMGYSKPMLSRITHDPESAHHITGYTPNARSLYQSRNKRDIDPELILRRYRDPLHRACCRLGTLEDIPQKRDCVTRKKIVEKYMRKADPCSGIFFDCCREVFGNLLRLSSVFSAPSDEIITSRNAPVQYTEPVHFKGFQLDKIEAETLVRSDFRETWLFDLVGVEDPSGKASLDVQLPHTITSWSVSAIALNQYKPMCIMPRPFRINTFQEIFIKLSMPYKIVQGEQIDMMTTLYNYSPQSQDVLVYMYGVEDLCANTEPGERSEQRRVRVDKHSSQALVFSMLPLKVGQYPIKVVAITLSSNNSDIVERQLNVVPRGKTVTEETTFSLDPLNQQRRSKRAIQTGNLVDEIVSTSGLQHSTIHLRPTRDSESIVPETQECIVSAIADKLGHVIQTSLLDVENLIRLPQGCGEQVMIYLGPTLYTAKYLESIDKLTGDLRWRAIRYIQSGYKRILNYRHDSGAFSAFPNREPSIWLTAFIAKMLCQTERTAFIADEIHVDKTVINSALSWLISQQNKETGAWVEMNPVYHREMLGGVLKESALAAFVTLTLNECAHHSTDLIEEQVIPNSEPVPGALSGDSLQTPPTNSYNKLKAATHLAEQVLLRDQHRALREKNPYVMAIAAYALSFNRPHDAVRVLDDLLPLAEHIRSKNQIFWRGRYQTETVAYALQAVIELAPLVSSQSTSPSITVNWRPGADALAMANHLSSQRTYSGAFESTQDTIVALEALSKFAQLQSSPNGNALVPQSDNGSPNLLCNITISNRTRRSIEFGKENAQIQRTFKLDSFDLDPMSGENLDILTSGSGLGTMSVKLKYNVYQMDDELCRFDIDSEIVEWTPPVSPKVESAPSDVQSSESTHADEAVFKRFDPAMLAALNVVDANQANTEPGDTDHASQPKPAIVSAPYLRLKRYTADPVHASSRIAIWESENSESWTSKMVSSLRSKLPDWIAPKTTTTTTTTEAPPPTSNTINYLSDTAGSVVARRNTTLRRSTQSPPIIMKSTGIPPHAPMNPLGERIEMTVYNKTANTTTIFDITNNPTHRLVLLIRVCTYHMAKRDSEMAVIEVGILSGFKPNEADLKEIINDPERLAMKYELSTDRSFLVFYMKYIPSSSPYCLRFRIVRDSPVYNLQSGYIRVYEYYSPTHSCANFYTPTRVNNLIDKRCDSSGQVCECAANSLCPATRKLIDLGEKHQTNTTSARNQLVKLICSNKYDLVSVVRLKSVRSMETAGMLKLTVKVKSDIVGNLTKIIDNQRQQKALLLDSVRKPQHGLSSAIASETSPAEDGDETSLDYLNLSIDLDCVGNDNFLLHFRHQSQWKQGGEVMFLFARANKLERKYFKSVSKAGTGRGPSPPPPPPIAIGPRPKPNIFSDASWQQSEVSPPVSLYDAQNQKYSLTLPLDKDTILHDTTYRAKDAPRESINNLLLWAELKSRRSEWECPTAAA